MVGGAPALGAPLPSMAQEDSVSPSSQAKFLFYLTLLPHKSPLIIPSYTHIHLYKLPTFATNCIDLFIYSLLGLLTN